MAGEGKPRWGRSAAAVAELGAGRPRYGLRSVLLGLLALLLVGASFTFLAVRRGDDSDLWATVANVAALASYLVAAPILHIAGIVYGIRGLIAGSGRVMSVVGILLNLTLIGTGIYIGTLAVGSIGAFR